MNCHECVRAAVERPAVAICRYCSVGLCREHCACLHQPERGFDTLTAGSIGTRPPAPQRTT